jgi:hypothetical protein
MTDESLAHQELQQDGMNIAEAHRLLGEIKSMKVST